MIIKTDTTLRGFEAWAGAIYTKKLIQIILVIK